MLRRFKALGLRGRRLGSGAYSIGDDAGSYSSGFQVQDLGSAVVRAPFLKVPLEYDCTSYVGI